MNHFQPSIGKLLKTVWTLKMNHFQPSIGKLLKTVWTLKSLATSIWMIANQRVLLKRTKKGALQVTSLQDKSTPGIYQRCSLSSNCEYKVKLTGIKKTSKQGSVNLWIGDKAKETIYLSKDSLPEDVVGTIVFHFYNNNRSRLHIGALFDKPTRGDQFQLINLTISKIKNRVTSTKGNPPNLNSKQQRKTRATLEKVYDKYWYIILQIVTNSSSLSLERIWYKILEHEYINTHRDFLYYNGKAIPYQQEEDFHKAIEYSRKPLLNTIKQFKPDAIVEAGAGWGKNLYYLFMRKVPTDIDYYGLELTNQGLKTMATMLHHAPEYKLYLSRFDFDSPKFRLEKRYNKLFLFTMWSIKEITWLNKMFFYLILDTADQITGIHLEPIGWQIRKRGQPYSYYNRNLYILLKELEGEGRIRIIEEQMDMIGFFSKINTASLLRWEKL